MFDFLNVTETRRRDMTILATLRGSEHGDCAAKQDDDYGCHGHRMILVDGVITGLTVTPASGSERDDRDPQAVARLRRVRRRIETVIGQLTEQFQIEKVRACDRWHLNSRLVRNVLAHTVGIVINRSLGRPDLQFAGLIAA